jgi:hypothetical protein
VARLALVPGFSEVDAMSKGGLRAEIQRLTDFHGLRTFSYHVILVRSGPIDKEDVLPFNKRSICPGCQLGFSLGDYYALLPIGPGDDTEQRRLCRAGELTLSYSIPVHWACATGEEANG